MTFGIVVLAIAAFALHRALSTATRVSDMEQKLRDLEKQTAEILRLINLPTDRGAEASPLRTETVDREPKAMDPSRPPAPEEAATEAEIYDFLEIPEE